MSQLLTPNPQLSLDLRVEREGEHDGIEMGVLKDGTPYLTGRGLARLCGVDQKAIVQITQAINAGGALLPRETKMIDLLSRQGTDAATIYIEINDRGKSYYAFPAPSCMAFLEYYAFEAGRNIRQEAINAFRRLAQKGLRDYIYSQLGYDPNAVPIAWKQFHDRVTATYGDIPAGYFTVFKEVADIIVTLIRHGADVGIHFIPDGSVGIHWGKYWSENDLPASYGNRIPTDHNYPEYFPQARSNPQSVHAYPDAALGAFRRWVREVYLPEKLPKYLVNKVRDGAMPIEFKDIALLAFAPKA